MSHAAYIALSLVPGIGLVRFEDLLRAFGTAEAVLDASWRDLCVVRGISKAAATAIRDASAEDGEAVLRDLAVEGGVALPPEDSRYPSALREIPQAPVLLFAAGRLELLQTPSVAIVGSRGHTRYGAEVTRHMAGGVARHGLTVVSGMARGLDAVAQGAALDVGGGTVGVLGNGLGVVYPAANHALYDRVRQHGCLVTEHPPGERPHAGSFPRRNRIISGLCRATLVVEAGAGSGALITADCALAQGHDVMAVPGPIDSAVSAGTNKLLQLGATPVLSLDDVLQEYGLVEAAPALSLPADLSDGERRALDALMDGAEQIDAVTSRLRCDVAEALAVLTSLEIRGLVVQESGKVFRRAPFSAPSFPAGKQ
ncbi:MAG: DNA-processing protein DprA [Gemmatimonadetes bacterium]|nr:DNA-processing protein DprA [Gemmatimonadota bacterium]